MSGIGIIGGGHAAVKLAQELRKHDYEGSIDLFERSSYRPYERPALSKEALEDGLDDDDIRLITDQALHSNHIFLNLNSEVRHLKPLDTRFEISLGSEETLIYDSVVLASGVKPRRLNIEANPRTPICYLQSYEDLLGIRMHLNPGKRVLIIGAGFIGLEVASSLKSQGLEVTVVERTGQVMNRVLSPEMAEFFAHKHKESGIDVFLESSIKASHFIPSRSSTEFTLSGGEVVEADMVLIAIGVEPKTEFLGVDLAFDGDHVLVDEHGQTSVEGIYAIGDIAARPNPRNSSMLAKIQSIDAAHQSAERLAAKLTGRASSDYSSWLPKFWSDQVGQKLQIAGLAAPSSNRLIRGSVSSGSFIVGHLEEGKLMAVEAVNAASEFRAARKLILDSVDIHPQDFSDVSKALGSD